MSIKREGEKQYRVYCDVCGTALPAAPSYAECIAQMRAARWSTHRERPGDWVNICPECRERGPVR